MFETILTMEQVKNENIRLTEVINFDFCLYIERNKEIHLRKN